MPVTVNHWTGFMKKLDRHMARGEVYYKIVCKDPVLDPDRIVNRALWGTDYDPKTVMLFRRYPKLPVG